MRTIGSRPGQPVEFLTLCIEFCILYHNKPCNVRRGVKKRMKKFFKIPALVVCDLFLCAITTLFSAVLIFEFDFKAAFTYLTLNMEYLFVWPTVVVFNLIFDSYSNLWRRAGLLDLLRLVGSVGCSAAIWCGLKLFGVIKFSGSILVLFFFFNFMFSAFARLLPRFFQVISSRSVTRATANRTVIVGCGETGTYLAQYFLTNPDKGFLPVAFVDNDPQLKDALISGLKVVGGDELLPAVIVKYNVSTVMVALSSASRADLRRIYGLVRNTDAALKIYSGVQDYDDSVGAKVGANLRNLRIEDLLGRDAVKLNNGEAKTLLFDATVLVTGGAGSIGSELCRQILQAGARRLVVYDFNENGLFYIGNELSERFGSDRFVTILGSVRDQSRLKAVFDEYRPVLVFHAAAHKHVPMMEINPLEAVKNNVFGTRNVLAQCAESGVKKCVLISSDKAVNPSNVMGATKRISELLFMDFNRQNKTEFCAVRFGNVLGSEGSIVPLFAKQIESGGPVTITDPEITRYFMTIPEAVSLVLQAGALAKGGEIFVLDMGEPVKIKDLAEDMIRLAGLVPGRDIKLKYIGLRPGEKMFEELSMSAETVDKTTREKIFVLRDNDLDPAGLDKLLEKLGQAVQSEDPGAAEREIFHFLPTDYRN